MRPFRRTLYPSAKTAYRATEERLSGGVGGCSEGSKGCNSVPQSMGKQMLTFTIIFVFFTCTFSSLFCTFIYLFFAFFFYSRQYTDRKDRQGESVGSDIGPTMTQPRIELRSSALGMHFLN